MFRNAASQQGRGFRSHWGLFCVEFFQAPEVGANKLTNVATVVCLPCILRNTALKPMIVVVNGWSRGNRAVIYNINSITPCCDRKCNRMLFVPPSHRPSAAGRCCLPSWRAVACFRVRLADTTQRGGAALWARRRERSSSCGGITLPPHIPTHYSSP